MRYTLNINLFIIPYEYDIDETDIVRKNVIERAIIYAKSPHENFMLLEITFRSFFIIGLFSGVFIYASSILIW